MKLFFSCWLLVLAACGTKSAAPERDSVRVETIVEYYPGGQIQSRRAVVNNIPEGQSTWYYESGAPKFRVNYHQGSEDGSAIEWAQDGQIKNYYYYGKKKYRAEYVGSLIQKETGAAIFIETACLSSDQSVQLKVDYVQPEHYKSTLFAHFWTADTTELEQSGPLMLSPRGSIDLFIPNWTDVIEIELILEPLIAGTSLQHYDFVRLATIKPCPTRARVPDNPDPRSGAR